MTEGRPRVTDLIPRGDLTGQELLSLAAAIEKRSEHPLGVAIVEYAREQELMFQLHQLYSVPGKARGPFVGERIIRLAVPGSISSRL